MSLCGAKWRRAPPRAGLYADPAVQVLVGLARLTRQAGEPEQEPGKGLRLSLPPELVGWDQGTATWASRSSLAAAKALDRVPVSFMTSLSPPSRTAIVWPPGCGAITSS